MHPCCALKIIFYCWNNSAGAFRIKDKNDHVILDDLVGIIREKALGNNVCNNTLTSH